MRNFIKDKAGYIVWGSIIAFIILDNHFDFNGSDNWTYEKEWDDDWVSDDYDLDGDIDESDFDFWKWEMDDDTKREILYGDK